MDDNSRVSRRQIPGPVDRISCRSRCQPLVRRCFLFFLLILTALPVSGQVESRASVDLYFFWSERCPHCLEARPIILEMAATTPWLQLHDREVYGNTSNREEYIAMAAALGQRAEAVPGFIFCNQFWTGFGPDTAMALKSALQECREHGLVREVKPETTDLPVPVNESIWLTTLMLAGMDAFNPCAFFVLLFLLSLLVHTHDRKKMALIGGIFILTSGVVYFVFMSAWLNLFLWLTELTWLTRTAGLIAVLIGILNLKDSWRPGQGPSLSLSPDQKNRLGMRMGALLRLENTPALLTGTLLLAVTANSYEFLCTAGFPMVYTRILTLQDLSLLQHYAFLGLYNLIYILPMILILVAFIATLGRRRLNPAEGQMLKLLAGLMMLGLGTAMLLDPGLLNNAFTGLLILALAILLTLLRALVFRRSTNRPAE